MDFVAVVVFGFIGAAAQIGAIGALLGFLRLMGNTSSGETITWHGIQVSTGLGSLSIAAALLAFMLAIAAVANYLSVRRARAIGRACTEASVLELIHLIDRADSMPDGMNARKLRSMGVRGSRLTGVSVENAIQLIHPLVQVLVLSGSLFWLDAWATGLLLPALLIPIPFLWRFNRKVRASANVFYDSAAPGFGRAVGHAVDTLQHSRVQNDTLKQAALDTYHNTPEVGEFFHSYDNMSLTSSRAILISSLFRPFILAYVLLLLGVQVSSGDMTWPGAIAFLLVLIQMTSRAEGLVAHVSVLSRLYTQVEPFVRFAAHVDDQSGSSHGGGEEDTAKPIAFEVDSVRVACIPGQPVQIFTGRPYQKFDLPALFDEIGPSVVSGLGLMKTAAFVGRRYRPSGAAGSLLMTGQAEPDDRSLAAVRKLAEDIGVAEEVEELLGQVLPVDAWEDLSPGARAILQIGPVMCSPSPAVLVDIAVLTQLERPEAEAVLEHLSDREVIILAPDYRSSCNFAEFAVALDDGRAVWAGDRKAWVASSVRARLIPEAGTKATIEVDPTLEDELV